MSRNHRLIRYCFLVASLLTTEFSFARADEIDQAIVSTSKAVAAGQQRHSSSLVEHAWNAIAHIRRARKQDPNPALKAANDSLKSAIATAYGTHSMRRDLIAARQAAMALKSLQSAKN